MADSDDAALPVMPRRLPPADAGARLETAAWLDVRDAAEFERAHVAGAGNLPLAEWPERRPELPPRDTPVVVVADVPDAARQAAEWLAAAGHAHVEWLDASWSAVALSTASGPGARLWRPAPFLESALIDLPRGRALDVACGSGRDAVYLALQGFDVDAWDHDAAALANTAALARRHDVAVHTLDVDLESESPPEFPAAAFALVVCFRYLHRPLFAEMARTLAPGGHLIYETFREGQERFGRPRRARFLLRPGELRAAFAGLEVLHYDEPSPEEGPLTARLLARKPR